MSCVFEGFHCSFLFFTLFVISQTSAKSAKSLAAATPIPSIDTQHCNNVYFYEAPNKKIETLLQEIKNDINVQKGGNKTSDFNCTFCKLLKTLTSKQNAMDKKMEELSQQNKNLEKKIDLLLGEKTNCSEVNRKDCADIYTCGQKASGVYRIHPDGQPPFDVYCDQVTAGGGWTVFQKRLDGSVDFYLGWNDYKAGFGRLNGEYWLGLDKLNRLTTMNNKRYKLRVNLEDTTGNTAYAQYDYFAVSSEQSKYQMSLGSYSGTAGDSLAYHKSRPFSTKDRDNDSYDKNCAAIFHGAWWYGSCHNVNLNGFYHHGPYSSYADGVVWQDWKGDQYSVKRAEMKIRPVDWIPL